MADLRQLVTSLGHADVVTYIQTGNVVFTPADADSTALASELRTAIAGSLGVEAPVIVVTRNELAAALEANPYKDEQNPRFVHMVFLPSGLDDAAHGQIRQAADDARSRGSKDEVTLAGRTLYLHTPDGFGTSELAKTLLTKRNSPAAAGTARNWNTVTKLLALCDG
jgi:uncharacterized protein (DUF1697 family)